MYTTAQCSTIFLKCIQLYSVVQYFKMYTAVQFSTIFLKCIQLYGVVQYFKNVNNCSRTLVFVNVLENKEVKKWKNPDFWVPLQTKSINNEKL